MKIKTISDYNLYKELFGDNLYLYTDEVIYNNNSKSIQTINSTTPQENIQLEKILQNINDNRENSAKPTPKIVLEDEITPNSKRERLKELYTKTLQEVKINKFNFPFIFGGGNAQSCELMVIYPQVIENDIKNPKRPFTDDNGRKILAILKQEGFNLKNSFIMPSYKFYTNEIKFYLQEYSNLINKQIIDIISPNIIICFDEIQGEYLIKNLKIPTNNLDSLHQKIFLYKNSKIIISYNYLDIIKSNTKNDLFINEDLPFIGDILRDLK